MPRGDVVRLITYLAENNANGSNDSAIAELEDKLRENCKRMRETGGSESDQGEGSDSDSELAPP